ncbi:MAG TPA: hypothetical protein VGH20_06940 [Myxococcales bacterium]|jgi:hypothetical protein
MNAKKPLIVAALVLVASCLLAELCGGTWIVKPSGDAPSGTAISGTDPAGPARVRASMTGAAREELDRPGLAIRTLALFDALLAVTYVIIAATIVLPERSIAAAGAVVTGLGGLVVLLGSILALFAAVGLTLTMVGLLFAAPFGTIVYLALWGTFPVGAAAATLGVILFCKLAFAVCLLLANPGFLRNKFLMVLLGVSILCNLVVSVLQGFPPSILASITDGVAAIVVAILSLVFAIVLVVRAIVAALKVVGSVRTV